MLHNSAGAATPGKGNGSAEINKTINPSVTADPAVAPVIAALNYADMGWRVVWAPRGLKYPKGITDWPGLATTDAATIVKWWTESPDANICLVTGPESGVWVLDVDDGPGKVGTASLNELKTKIGPLPRTRTHGTRSGGIHYLFSYQGVDFELKNDAGTKLGKDLDIRGQGGQVVAPPSFVFADSKGPEGFYTVLDDAPLAGAPNALLDLLRPAPVLAPQRPEGDSGPVGGGYTGRAITEELGRIRTAPNGSGNHTLASATYNIATLAASPWSDVTPEQAYQAVQEAISTWTWDCEDHRKRDLNTINKQFQYGMNHPRPKPARRERDPFAGMR